MVLKFVEKCKGNSAHFINKMSYRMYSCREWQTQKESTGVSRNEVPCKKSVIPLHPFTYDNLITVVCRVKVISYNRHGSSNSTWHIIVVILKSNALKLQTIP